MINNFNGEKLGNGIVWPDGRPIAFALGIEFEAETLRISQLARQGKEPDERDQGRYGANEGIPRILRMLCEYGIKATFFTPGWVVENYPERVKSIVSAGHELAYHGWNHIPERGTARSIESAKMERSENAIKKVFGRRPVGHRAPHSTLHEDAYSLMVERGYLYSSNLRDCDYGYLRPDGIVELPTDVLLDDFTYFYYSTAIEPGHRVPFTNSKVFEIWREEFDGMILERDKLFNLKLHPQIIGRAGRIKMLSDFIGYALSKGAWFATCEQIALYIKKYEEKGGRT
ncbi:MAG: polysaccharide deacetylase [Ruminococcaceae bacterium]|nr:polysaccharide deacetylase [Oscillospiraceae bacterium]